MADTKHPYADIFVPQEEIGGLRVAAPARVVVDASSQSYGARVEDIGRRTEFTPRYLFSERERSQLVVRVRVRIDDPSRRSTPASGLRDHRGIGTRGFKRFSQWHE